MDFRLPTLVFTSVVMDFRLPTLDFTSGLMDFRLPTLVFTLGVMDFFLVSTLQSCSRRNPSLCEAHVMGSYAASFCRVMFFVYLVSRFNKWIKPVVRSSQNRSLSHPNQNRPLSRQDVQEERLARMEKVIRMDNEAKKAALGRQKVGVGESVICAICLDECQGWLTNVTLNCGHQYHATCLIQWLRKKTTCPLCRRPC